MPQVPIYDSNAERQAAYRKRRAQAVKTQAHHAPLPAMPVLPTVPGDPRWRSAIEHAHLLIEQTTAEMRQYFDDRREAWQDSERGDAFTERCDALESLRDELADWIQTYGRR